MRSNICRKGLRAMVVSVLFASAGWFLPCSALAQDKITCKVKVEKDGYSATLTDGTVVKYGDPETSFETPFKADLFGRLLVDIPLKTIKTPDGEKIVEGAKVEFDPEVQSLYIKVPSHKHFRAVYAVQGQDSTGQLRAACCKQVCNPPFTICGNEPLCYMCPGALQGTCVYCTRLTMCPQEVPCCERTRKWRFKKLCWWSR